MNRGGFKLSCWVAKLGGHSCTSCPKKGHPEGRLLLELRRWFQGNRRRKCRRCHHCHLAFARSRRGWCFLLHSPEAQSAAPAGSARAAADRNWWTPKSVAMWPCLDSSQAATTLWHEVSCAYRNVHECVSQVPHISARQVTGRVIYSERHLLQKAASRTDELVHRDHQDPHRPFTNHSSGDVGRLYPVELCRKMPLMVLTGGNGKVSHLTPSNQHWFLVWESEMLIQSSCMWNQVTLRLWIT